MRKRDGNEKRRSAPYACSSSEAAWPSASEAERARRCSGAEHGMHTSASLSWSCSHAPTTTAASSIPGRGRARARGKMSVTQRLRLSSPSRSTSAAALCAHDSKRCISERIALALSGSASNSAPGCSKNGPPRRSSAALRSTGMMSALCHGPA
jgi:hypothetical protein